MGLLSSSIARKIAMSLSALFLLVFLLQHCIINFISVVSPDGFNAASHFMGTNPLIQYVMQPVLAFGVVFHFVMGFVLELKNRKARPVKYAMNKGSENSTWMSRNMIISGVVVLLFFAIHFMDFWFPELNIKYIKGDMSGMEHGEWRYYAELKEEFSNPIRIALYCLAFVFLSLHLMHGFESAFQSLGLRHKKYTPFIKKLGTIYSIAVPLAFIFIAVYHFINS